MGNVLGLIKPSTAKVECMVIQIYWRVSALTYHQLWKRICISRSQNIDLREVIVPRARRNVMVNMIERFFYAANDGIDLRIWQWATKKLGIITWVQDQIWRPRCGIQRESKCLVYMDIWIDRESSSPNDYGSLEQVVFIF